MKRIHKEKWFWPLIFFAVIIITWIIIANRKVDGSRGGILEGASHKNGGIKAKIKSTGETVILEGNEDVLTKKVNEIQDQYTCYGTPGGIASEINVIGEGVKFADGGKCIKQ